MVNFAGEDRRITPTSKITRINALADAIYALNYTDMKIVAAGIMQDLLSADDATMVADALAKWAHNNRTKGVE